MAQWGDVSWFAESTPKDEISLAMQALSLQLHGDPSYIPLEQEVKTALLGLAKLCRCEAKLQVRWCQLAALSLNRVKCTFSSGEMNACTSFILDACRAANYAYTTVEALGALLYDTDLNVLNCLDVLLGEGGEIPRLVLGSAPEREVQHLALRCLNNMLNSVTDEVLVMPLVRTICTLVESRLHGDNLNRARLRAGAMKCLQTVSRQNRSQYLAETTLNIIKGVLFEGSGSGGPSPAISFESMSLDELNMSDFSESGQSRYSQPRVRNKKGKSKRRPAEGYTESRGTPPVRGGAPTEQPWRRKAEPAQSPPPNVWSTSNQQRLPPNKNAPKTAGVTPSPKTPPVHKKTALPASPATMDGAKGDFAVSTSESEYSESDSEEGLLSKVLAVRCRTRLASLQTLQACVSTVHKSRMYSVWSAFLPSDSSHGLLPVLGREQNVKCRIAGLGALATLIESSRHYFVAADCRQGNEKAAYTPFSRSLASDLSSLHGEMVSQVPGCQVAVLPHHLQCLSVLVTHTPFSKLPRGIISKILDVCREYMRAEGGQVKVQGAALNLLCTCLTVETPFQEVGEWLGRHPEVFTECVTHLRALSHQKECLQITCQLLRFYFTPLLDRWRLVAEVGKFTLEASPTDAMAQSMALLVLEELGRALAAQIEKSESGGVEVGEVREHWLGILSGVVVPILQDENSQIMAGACDIISTIGNTVFSSFEVHTQRLIMTLLLALTNPTVPATSSACRCLGVLVMYPCIRDDLLFVADTANAIISALETTETSDRALILRVSWSLGNLSDTLVVNKGNNPSFVSDFSDLLLGRLLDVSLKSAESNDKVKSNIVRALGNLLRFMKQSTYDKIHFKDYVTRSVECLLRASTSGMMKTRWNACHALVNALQNPVISPVGAEWAPLLFETLSSVIVHCKNFKVRINAVLALAQPPSRACYGTHFARLWATVCSLLGEEGGGGGPAMAGYTDRLRLQLLLLLCHLICVHDAGDRASMTSALGRMTSQAVGLCSDGSTGGKLTEKEADQVDSARAVVRGLLPEMAVAMEMLSPRQLPDDSQAFRTSDIRR